MYIEVIKVLIKSYFISLFLMQKLFIQLVFLGGEGVPFLGGAGKGSIDNLGLYLR